MKEELKQFQYQHPPPVGVFLCFFPHHFVTHTAFVLRTAAVPAAVWNLDQHLPLREKQIADFTLYPHFILLLAK